MQDTITFGQWVKQRRKALSLTQTELGRLVFCSAVMIKKIEGNQRRPSAQVAKLLARYLKIAPKNCAAFLSLARPDLSAEQIDELLTAYDPIPSQTTSLRRITNLPVPMTPLIGRAQEVSAICALLLEPHVRLVTLTGAGGMGKTRLSLQVAREINNHFIDGCWFISLAALEEQDLLIPTIARGLGVKESRHQTFEEALISHLAERDMLIVLDNFEQIIPAARQVAEILSLAPRLKVLVTSRTVLHLSGEHEFVVPPLRFVDPRNAPSGAELADSPAVALFVQKARAVNINFALTPENSPTVAKICARLDGLPLAIELAASRSKFINPAGLLARLEGSAPNDGPLAVLSDGAQDLPPRQQTMRRAIDWSYQLLNKSEQDLFRWLAVFVGGCTLDAAVAVCGETTSDSLLLTPPVHATHAIADKLASLVAQSMLRQVETPDEAPRYVMLESLREYAIERLSAQEKEWTLLRRHHARYFMALAQAAEPKLQGIEQEIWLDRLEVEHDNLQAALAWSQTSEEEAEIGLLLAGAAWQFWLVRGYVNEGRVWLLRLLEQAKSAPGLARARALNGAGFLNWAWGDYREANSLLHKSLSVFRELGDQYGMAWALNHLGHVALAQNELTLARRLVQESLASFRELGADWNIAWDLLNLGDIVRALGDEPQAVAHYRESLELFRKVGDYRGTAWTLDHLGRLAYTHQDYKQTMALLTESLGLFRQVGDKRSIAWVLNHLGGVALAQNDFQQARFYVEESLALFREMSSFSNSAGAALDLGQTALSLGDTAWELGEKDRAKMLFIESLKLSQEAGDQQGIDDALDRIERYSYSEDG